MINWRIKADKIHRFIFIEDLHYTQISNEFWRICNIFQKLWFGFWFVHISYEHLHCSALSPDYLRTRSSPLLGPFQPSTLKRKRRGAGFLAKMQGGGMPPGVDMKRHWHISWHNVSHGRHIGTVCSRKQGIYPSPVFLFLSSRLSEKTIVGLSLLWSIK